MLTYQQVLCEIDKPRKNFVRGMIIAVGIICLLYMLVNASYVSANLFYLNRLLSLASLTYIHR